MAPYLGSYTSPPLAALSLRINVDCLKMENGRPIVYLFVGIAALISRPGTGGTRRPTSSPLAYAACPSRPSIQPSLSLTCDGSPTGWCRVLLDYGEDREDRELSHQMHSLSLHDQAHNYLDRGERCALPDRMDSKLLLHQMRLLLAVTYTIPSSWAPRVFTTRLSSKSIDHFLEVNITEGQI